MIVSKGLKTGSRILAVGDSITNGVGAFATQSYPAILQSLIGIEVINAGINGETSAQGLARLPGVLEDGTIRLMLLCYGTNDIVQGRSMKQLKNHLRAMIDLAKSKSIVTVVIGIPDPYAMRTQSLPLYDEIAAVKDVGYLPSLLPEVVNEPAYMSDEVHPNAKGYRFMAEHIARFIQNTYPRLLA